MLSKPVFTYLGMVLAVVAIVFGEVKPEYAATMWAIAGFFGFGSITLLRSMIDSKGWKTHAIFAVIAVLSVLQLAGIVIPEVYQTLIVAFAPVTGITIQQALAKSPTASVPKVK